MKRVFVTSFGSDAGGIEISLINFLSLICSFSKVDLFLWRPPGILFSSMNKIASIISPTVYPGDLRRAISYKFPIGLIWYICFRLFRLMDLEILTFKPISQSYDIAISYSQNGYSPYFVIDKVRATKKILWYHHGSYEKLGRAKQKDLTYYYKYDTIVTVSEANKAMLLSHFPELTDKIIVIKNIIDREAIIRKSQLKSDARKVPEVCNIITVGRVAPEKGQTFALEIAKELKESGFSYHWFFVGDGPDWEKCLALLKEYNIENYCSFIGAQTNPYPYMDMAHLYVQPSLVESECLTIQEAKVLKKTIIASDIPAIRETLNNGEFGVLCHTNATAFAHTIINVSNDEALKRKLQKNLSRISEENNLLEDQIIQLLA